MKLIDNEKEIKTQLAILEYHLIANFRPTFIVIANPTDDNIIQIVLSCRHFEFKSIPTRIHTVFMLIKQKMPDIMKDYLFVVQCFNSTEMEQVLVNVFDEQ